MGLVRCGDITNGISRSVTCVDRNLLGYQVQRVPEFFLNLLRFLLCRDEYCDWHITAKAFEMDHCFGHKAGGPNTLLRALRHPCCFGIKGMILSPLIATSSLRDENEFFLVTPLEFLERRSSRSWDG